jgi:cellulose synthase/poly-beta-1,6-N-acetylglucosamine synthase-like glycosyltransferase
MKICTRSSMLRSVCFSGQSRKLSNVVQSLDGWQKNYNLELLRASEATLSRWFRLHLQSLAPTNPHRARVVDYGPFSLRVILKEGLCLRSGDINRLMMMMIMMLTGVCYLYFYFYYKTIFLIIELILRLYSNKVFHPLFTCRIRNSSKR